MDHLNGEIRVREKITQELKKNTSILTGYQLFRNYIRPYIGLEGRTPCVT